MIDNNFDLSLNDKAVIVSITTSHMDGHKNTEETMNSLQEMRELLRTLGIEFVKEVIQNKKTIEAGTILGTGKLEEIAMDAKALGAKLLIFDFELSASQARNIRKLTDMTILDRVSVILEIFAKHAQTKEAKIQIEISKLQYFLPRLSSLWGHLGRQKGGIGIRGGEGEQQIELDRRMIRQRIEFYKKELKALATSRKEQKKKRQKQTVTAALVGYTNAGKSSLMNRLCRVDILEEDKLFATLDSTFRTLNPDTKPPMILIDTVGFISNLPSTLIEGFKSTLESAMEADLLIHVVDVSSPNFKKNIDVTNEVLKELKIGEKDQFIVFNKKDLLNNSVQEKIVKRLYPDSYIISSFDNDAVATLRQTIVDFFLKKQRPFDLFIPYDAGEIHASIAAKTNIIVQRNLEKGIFYRIRVPDFIYYNLNIDDYVLAKEHPFMDMPEII